MVLANRNKRYSFEATGMKCAALFIPLALAGCGGTVVQDRPTVVKVPVTVPCVSGARPDPVASLKAQHPDWGSYTPKQKAALVAAQAGRHQNYGKDLDAATSACK